MGTLKLKGDDTKKKKKKSTSSSKLKDPDDAQGHQPAASSSNAVERASPTKNDSRSGTPSRGTPDLDELDAGKTAAEKRFAQVQRARLAEKAAKGAKTSHKDRVAEFNKKLENMSEHYDIPKVGPG